MKVLLLQFLIIQIVRMSTAIAVYYFNSSSYSSEFLNHVNNSIPLIQQPSTSGYDSSRDVEITDKGVYITHNKFLTINSNFSGINTATGSFGIWVYYIQGEMREFLHFNYNHPGRSLFTDVIFKHTHTNRKFDVYVNNKAYNISVVNQVKTGWNWFSCSGSSMLLF